MRKTARSWRTVCVAFARNLTISMAAGVAFVFVMFISRKEFWTWRLFLLGALGGFTVYFFAHFLDEVVGERIRRLRLVPDKLVGVPLYFIGGNLGVLVAISVLQALGLMPFDMRGTDLRFALLINGVLAVVVGLLFYSSHVMRERLRESIERIKEQEFAEKELQLARSIQSRLMPPARVDGDGFAIEARNLPAGYVAGDFYDVFRLPDGRLGLVIADVSGKGVGASLTMASVKAVLPLIAASRSTAETLRELNRKLAVELAPREFVALLHARFDPATRELELANAGLPDPYRLRAGLPPEPLGVPGPRFPLGSRASVDYESFRTHLGVGERALFLTDGLPEALRSDGGPLGYEALADLLADAPASSGEWLDRFLARVRGATSETLEDDWTVMLLESRRLGESSPESEPRPAGSDVTAARSAAG